MVKEQKLSRKNHHKSKMDIQMQINMQFQQYIEDIIKVHPGASENEISYLLDMDKSIVNYFIKQMEQKGLIRLSKDVEGHILCYMRRGTSNK
jgi:DNA-binding MarR family transcriptional regulator